MNKNIIEIKNLVKKYNNGKKIVINNVSLDIKEGEKIGIIGANGSGKTTLVEQIVGVTKPTSGKIKYNFKYNKTPQEKIGMQFQDSSYPPGLSVKDIIIFSLQIYKFKISEKNFLKILDIFRIRDFFYQKAKNLSGGQQQRLNVFLAIVHNPKIIILDEISTGLDIVVRKQILNHVNEIITKNNSTLILVSHDVDEINYFCSRIIVLSQSGKIIFDDSKKNILKKWKDINVFLDKFLYNNGSVKNV